MRAYVVITPARDEASNLPRLVAALAAQTIRPRTWLIVDNGSTDGTVELGERLAADHAWIRVLAIPAASATERGAPVVRALVAGIEALGEPPEVLVKVDADISIEPDYFERLLEKFEADPSLGIASGSAYELEEGAWRQRYVTGTTVWGALRAYRWECLQAILPLEERFAWDGLDEFRANSLGWRTHAFEELPFRHHRREGERDGTMWRARINQGRAARYLGYRPWYLVLRALWQARREPAAFGLIWGYADAVLRRAPQNADESARAYLRQQQSLRRLRLRALEASGRRRRAA
jgi:biofilm PGA synthesis N-glycosyltransferase PgaC